MNCNGAIFGWVFAGAGRGSRAVDQRLWFDLEGPFGKRAVRPGRQDATGAAIVGNADVRQTALVGGCRS